jgi:pantetheine-phosphate adenylyltransferase
MKKKKKGVYAGTFDPFTFGHLDILKRSVELFDEVLVGVAENPEKKPLFPLEERVEMIKETLAAQRLSVEVKSFSGVLVDFMKREGVTILIRGLRAVSDYEYELQMALTNKNLYPEMETVFLVASPCFSFLSSSIVKEVFLLGGKVGDWVPPCVEKRLKTKLNHSNEGV